MRKISLFISYLFLFSVSCVDPYKMPDIPFDAGILVIDGFINSSNGTITTIKLSRSTPLDYAGKLRSELKAKVTLEGSDNSSMNLAEKGNGVYENSLVIHQQLKYRMRIKTLGGKEYLSDFVEVKKTPPIDSVTFQLDKSNNGLQIQVNTHDAESKARNYFWEYVETWQSSAECFVQGPIQTFTCWNTASSSKILSFSTKRFEQDVVSRFPINFIDANSPKQYFTYSILVKQYAVTEDARDYLQQLKNNTEKLGSIFDAQPTQLTGNFYSLQDHDEPVLGYLQVQNVTEKRIFIKHINLPSWFKNKPVRWECFNPDPYECIGGPECYDCRLGGGVNVKPNFWIE